MKILACFLFASLVLTACQTRSVNTVERANPLALPQGVVDRRVQADVSLSETLRVLAVNQTLVSGDLLKLQVRVENLSQKTQFFRYRIEWYDREGFLVETSTDLWKPLILQGREVSSLTSVALSPKAVDFVVKFQESR